MPLFSTSVVSIRESLDMVGTRGKGDVDTGTNHLGFRLVLTPTSVTAASSH